MSALLVSILFVVSMWFGSPAPATVTLVPNNGDDAVNTAVISSFGSLSNHEIEAGVSVGIFEVLCSENGSSTANEILPMVFSYEYTTSGGNYPANIEVTKCSNLTSLGGATYQAIGTTLELGFSCNSDCEVYYLTAQFEQAGFDQFEVGKIWVSVTGPNPELIVVEK